MTAEGAGTSLQVRVELRALPSGPTRADMLANAAFLLGLMLALRDETHWMLPAFPFVYLVHPREEIAEPA